MSLHGDYKEVQGLDPTQACRKWIKTDNELKDFKKNLKAKLVKMRIMEKDKKNLKNFILKNLKNVDKRKFEVKVDHVDVPAFEYDKITILKPSLKSILSPAK